MIQGFSSCRQLLYVPMDPAPPAVVQPCAEEEEVDVTVTVVRSGNKREKTFQINLVRFIRLISIHDLDLHTTSNSGPICVRICGCIERKADRSFGQSSPTNVV